MRESVAAAMACWVWLIASSAHAAFPERPLRYVVEYTPGEIAELLDLPRGTVNSRLRRGLDRMKEQEA